MKLQAKSLVLAAAAVTFAGSASAQVMTELRMSTALADEEFVEIQAAPGQSTDGLMFCQVESDSMNGFVGFLDNIFDLSGDVFDANGYYTVGNDTVIAANPGVFDVAFSAVPGNGFSPNSTTTSVMENSNQTYYLLSVPDLAQRDMLIAMVNSDVSSPMGSATTIFASTPGVTILDVVLPIEDQDFVAFDGAPTIGPDGTFLPGGVYRPDGCQNGWCTNSFLKFSLTDPAVLPYVEPTPGAANPTAAGCITVAGVGAGICGASSIGTATSCMVNPNSVGLTANLSAFGSAVAAANDVTLQVTDTPPSVFGFFLNSQTTGFLPNIGNNGQGNLCLDGGSVGRFNRAGEIIQMDITGSGGLMIDLTDIPRPMNVVSVNAGETWYFQFWYRDVANMAPASNLTNALEVTFQ